MADPAFAEQFGDQQGEYGLQGGDLLGAWQTGVGDGCGKVQFQQLRQEQEQASSLGEEASATGQGLWQNGGKRWHFRTIFSAFSWLRRKRSGPCPGGQTRLLQQAEEVGLTQVVAFARQLGMDVREG